MNHIIITAPAGKMNRTVKVPRQAVQGDFETPGNPLFSFAISENIIENCNGPGGEGPTIISPMCVSPFL